MVLIILLDHFSRLLLGFEPAANPAFDDPNHGRRSGKENPQITALLR